jgi:hypothetical protein
MLSVIGWFVLVFGLLGEGEFGYLVSRADGQLQTFDLIVLGDAIRSTGSANERATKLERENLKLQQLIQPRSLTLEQQRQIGVVLTYLAGKNVRVASLANDPEAYQFGEQLVSALRSAKITVEDKCGVFWANVGDAKRSGVLIQSWREDAAASAIGNALSEIGKVKPVSVENIKLSGQPTSYLSISIDAKPLPVLR